MNVILRPRSEPGSYAVEEDGRTVGYVEKLNGGMVQVTGHNQGCECGYGTMTACAIPLAALVAFTRLEVRDAVTVDFPQLDA